MAIPFMQMPAYNPGNSLLNFEPIQQALQQKIRADQMAVENQFRERDFGMREQEFKAQQQSREDAALQKLKERSAGIAQLALEDQDQARGQQQFTRLIQSDPRWQKGFSSVGIDPTKDWRSAAQYLIAEARGYQDPLDRKKAEAQIEASQAQAAAARAQAGEQYGFSSGYVYNKRTGEARPVQSGDTVDKDLIEREGALRREFTGQQAVKDYQVVRDAYSNIKASAAEPSAAGDLSLIFSYMKLLDPQSVVREQEFANAQNAAGVPDRVRNLWNRALSGERLNPEQRADFIKQAEQQYKVRNQQYTSIRDQYVGVAKNARTRPDQVVLDYGVAGPKPPPGSTGVPGVVTSPAGQAQPNAPAAPVQRPRAVNPQTGETIEWNGQQWERVN